MLRRLSCAASAHPLRAAVAHALAPTTLSNSTRGCSSGSSSSGSGSGNGNGVGVTAGSTLGAKSTAFSASRPGQRAPSINCVTLVGVVHDIQTGYVFEDAVTQFTLTTTSLDTTNSTQECVVEKDHHTVRCFGDVFSQEMRSKLAEGNVVCVNGRLRLNPQLESSCNKYYYFPYIQVQPPHGQVSVVYGDRRSPPAPVNAATGELNTTNNGSSSSSSSGGGGGAGVGATSEGDEASPVADKTK
ncbi:MP18 RNA editing complex protein [Novymonas esmeraldas]|uniref:MP18 RNA editing complex protein n=1 Tax=Novymonas esmeraldas TaxID=1808958 RepID=A0AAW0ETG2_9TRYP